MSLRSTLRAAVRRGVVVTASIFLLGVAGVTQPTVELIAPPAVQAGDTVEIVLRIRNDGDEPIDVELSGRRVGFDVVIARAPGERRWPPPRVTFSSGREDRSIACLRGNS